MGKFWVSGSVSGLRVSGLNRILPIFLKKNEKLDFFTTFSFFFKKSMAMKTIPETETPKPLTLILEILKK